MSDTCDTPTEVPITEQFSVAVTALAEYKDYFTDDKKNRQLIAWVEEELNVGKTTARFLVKHIAPFVIGKLVSNGKVVGKAWARKLHDRLSQHSAYLAFTLKLLNLLKTKTDRSYEQALDIPSDDNLGKLISDPARWSNLKPDQQAFVQLLLGQNQITEGQDILRRQLDKLVHSLTFDLDLNTPDDIADHTQNTERGSAQWLTYNRRQADLIGRENDFNQLHDFLDQKENFSWWLVSGVGGIGKSRFALELMIEQQLLWEVGFLPKSKLDKPDALANWQPSTPTLIVIDYAAEKADALSDWLEHLTKHRNDYDFPVRLLLLEREYKEQAWWETLTPKRQGDNYRQHTLYSPQPHELQLLTQEQQRSALHSFLDALEAQSTLPDNDDTFWQALHELSDKGRPLFIGMAAIAIANGGLHNIRDWGQDELLDYVYQHERDAWLRQIKSSGFSDKQDAVLTLLTLSTVTAGFAGDLDADSVYEAAETLELFDNETQIGKALALLSSLTGQVDGYLQPDIFAEYAVLQHWQSQHKKLPRSVRKQLSAAYRIAKKETIYFLRHLATDYPNHHLFARSLWEHIYETESEENFLEQLEGNALSSSAGLMLKGYFDDALKYWIVPAMSSQTETTSVMATMIYAQHDVILRMTMGLNEILENWNNPIKHSDLEQRNIEQYKIIYQISKLFGDKKLIRECDRLAKNLQLTGGWSSLISAQHQSLEQLLEQLRCIPQKPIDTDLTKNIIELSYFCERE